MKKERIGLRYGRLLVIDKLYIRGLGTGWKCQCDCGKEIYAAGHNLDSGNTASCGCLAIEVRTTHGKTKSRAYVIWKAMHQRCGNPKAMGYQNYGGRGIKICDEWQTFEPFFADMGDPPDGHSLERVDNNGNYQKSNCRWASYKEQLNNTRHNRVIEAFGRKQTFTQWAEEFNLSPTTLRNRIDRSKIPPEQALTLPKQKGVKLLK